LSFESQLRASSTRRFLAAAAIWHVAFVLAVFVVGRAQIWPETFDRNGIGISFGIDSSNYRVEAQEMAKLIEQGKLRDWTRYNASFHVKLYSLSFALLGRLIGFNILAAEPLNLICYLSILSLAWAIAREAFQDERVARFATVVVALWPSLVLHTTQLLRDTMFIPSMLLLTLVLLLAATKTLSLKQGFLLVMPGAFAALLLWLCRGDMWELVLLIMLVGATLCVLIQVRNRRFLSGNIAAVATLLLISFFIPKVVPTHRQSNILLSSPLPGQTAEAANIQNAPNNFEPEEPTNPISKLAYRLALLRHRFIIRYPLAGSNLDTNVELRGTAAIFRYLPRAAVIGFLAPFPNMWFTKGAQVGLSGRLIAGAEMSLMYLLIGFAVYAGIRQRHRMAIWLLFSIPAIGCVALGFVVVNISTLYRMRYAYFIIIIILGIKGLFYLAPINSYRRTAPDELQEQFT
jgi:hypothetical protein